MRRASIHDVQTFSLDLSGQRRDLLTKYEIERVIRQIGPSLANASALKVLAMRLVSFDTSMKRRLRGCHGRPRLASSMQCFCGAETRGDTCEQPVTNSCLSADCRLRVEDILRCDVQRQRLSRLGSWGHTEHGIRGDPLSVGIAVRRQCGGFSQQPNQKLPRWD